MISMVAPFAALLFSLTGFSVGCSHKPTGLVVRIADVGRCSDLRDIILEVLPGGGLKLNSKNQKHEELERRLGDIFRTRAVRYVFVIGDPSLPFGEVAEVIDIAAKQADYVAIVTPSVMKKATYLGGGCLPSEKNKDTCLDPKLPVDYITHSDR
jgi:hypothetical protein